ncbi:MAG: hypothetical protein ACI935_003249 [Moritella dasanensis]|jgi:hypothetical protein
MGLALSRTVKFRQLKLVVSCAPIDSMNEAMSKF